jgi:hypothetical protein
LSAIPSLAATEIACATHVPVTSFINCLADSPFDGGVSFKGAFLGQAIRIQRKGAEPQSVG